MKCPKCASEKFEEFETEGVTVDFCRDCKAIWFDQGELAFYSDTEQDLPSLQTAARSAQETDFSCPKCPDTQLLEIKYYPNEELLVDYCTQCSGLLLDKKEVVALNDIIGRHGLARVGRIIAQLRERGYEVVSG